MSTISRAPYDQVFKNTIREINEGCGVIRKAVQKQSFAVSPALETVITSDPYKEVQKIVKKIRLSIPDISKDEAGKLGIELYGKMLENPADQKLVNNIVQDLNGKRDIPFGHLNLAQPSSHINTSTMPPQNDLIKRAIDQAIYIKQSNFPVMSRQTMLSLIYDLYEKLSSGIPWEDSFTLRIRTPASSDDKMMQEALRSRISEKAKPLEFPQMNVDMAAMAKTVRLLTRLKKIYPQWSKEQYLQKIIEIYHSLTTGTKRFEQWSLEIPTPFVPDNKDVRENISITRKSLSGPGAGMMRKSLPGPGADMIDISQEIMKAVQGIKDGLLKIKDANDDMKLIETVVTTMSSPDLIRIREETEKAKIKLAKSKSALKLLNESSESEDKIPKKKESKKRVRTKKRKKKLDDSSKASTSDVTSEGTSEGTTTNETGVSSSEATSAEEHVEHKKSKDKGAPKVSKHGEKSKSKSKSKGKRKGKKSESSHGTSKKKEKDGKKVDKAKDKKKTKSIEKDTKEPAKKAGTPPKDGLKPNPTPSPVPVTPSQPTPIMRSPTNDPQRFPRGISPPGNSASPRGNQPSNPRIPTPSPLPMGARIPPSPRPPQIRPAMQQQSPPMQQHSPPMQQQSPPMPGGARTPTPLGPPRTPPFQQRPQMQPPRAPPLPMARPNLPPQRSPFPSPMPAGVRSR
ncbi:unnamed protein product [Gordionus sp. m RMFG-2023]